ncbi:MAG: hypothetical protein K2J78_01130, partial [Muribaculaceae bacterium]|nr:hypothetical protein [Muribaculaceae bacterium]
MGILIIIGSYAKAGRQTRVRYVEHMKSGSVALTDSVVIATGYDRLGRDGTLDDMSATYTGNRLTSMSIDSDAGVFASQTGLRNTGSFSLTYDAAGRLKTDPVRGITS